VVLGLVLLVVLGLVLLCFCCCQYDVLFLPYMWPQNCM
jgi:hypothetical protein